MKRRITRAPSSRPLVLACRFLVMVAAVVLVSLPPTSAQSGFPSGQNIAPAYEGWEQNPDGTFTLVFGYFNRNWDEEIDLPIGADNKIEPGNTDQGQPTRFFPRRNRFVFGIRVPKDFGSRELVWTLTSHGVTERAYGTLKPDYFIDDIIVMNNFGAGGPGGGLPDTLGNKAPILEVPGEPSRLAGVGKPVTLLAIASDDGKPKPRPMPGPYSRLSRMGRGTPNTATGLRISWFVYRGAGKVTFDPPQIKVWEDYREGGESPWSAGWSTPPAPPDGKWNTRATFSEPGTYVLRCLAHDGGLMAYKDVTVVVNR